MDVARPMLADEARVARRDVADVRREPVARIERVHPKHRPVADYLRHDRGRRDRRTPLVAIDDRHMLRRRGPETESVHKARLGWRRQRVQRATKAVQVRSVQPRAVDLARRDDLHGDSGRAVENCAKQLLPILARDLLRVVQLRERANAMVAQRVVIEQNARDDERAGE